MRILWVEDFGDAVAENICRIVFISVLSERHLALLAETQRPHNKNRPNGYEAWRVWHDGKKIFDGLEGEPEIDICRTFKDFDEQVKSGYIVDRYDAVLLDINLENNFFEKDTVANPAEGGFRLYNKLAHAGFPSGRIALLTAHSLEQMTTDFQMGCEKYGHESLVAFGKKTDAVGGWINKLAQANDGFLHLRRGVLDGIAFAEELLNKHNDDAIRFNQYVRDDKLSFDQALDHLYSLRHLIPIRVSKSEVDFQLRGFRYLLGCEWDRAKPNEGSDFVYQALGYVMKYLRNWSSHGHLLDKASISDIAYLALAGLRTGYFVPENVESELRPYEHWLLSAMGNSTAIDHSVASKQLANSYIRVRLRLKKEVQRGGKARMKRKDGTWLLQDQTDFHAMVNEFALAKKLPADFDFLLAIREVFIHATLFPEFHGITIDVLSDSQAIESAYCDALRQKFDTLPCWVKATWAHLTAN